MSEQEKGRAGITPAHPAAPAEHEDHEDQEDHWYVVASWLAAGLVFAVVLFGVISGWVGC